MSTETLTLADFLLARYDEEEAGARAADRPAPRFPEQSWLVPWDSDPEGIERPAWDHLNRWSPARVLAECRRNRRMVAYAIEVSPPYAGPYPDHLAGMNEAAWAMLALLALPYADHPDYRPEWRP